MACVQTGSRETDVVHELYNYLRVLLADRSLYIRKPVQCMKGLIVQPHESQTGRMTSIWGPKRFTTGMPLQHNSREVWGLSEEPAGLIRPPRTGITTTGWTLDNHCAGHPWMPGTFGHVSSGPGNISVGPSSSSLTRTSPWIGMMGSRCGVSTVHLSK